MTLVELIVVNGRASAAIIKHHKRTRGVVVDFINVFWFTELCIVCDTLYVF